MIKDLKISKYIVSKEISLNSYYAKTCRREKAFTVSKVCCQYMKKYIIDTGCIKNVPNKKSLLNWIFGKLWIPTATNG